MAQQYSNYGASRSGERSPNGHRQNRPGHSQDEWDEYEQRAYGRSDIWDEPSYEQRFEPENRYGREDSSTSSYRDRDRGRYGGDYYGGGNRGSQQSTGTQGPGGYGYAEQSRRGSGYGGEDTRYGRGGFSDGERLRDRDYHRQYGMGGSQLGTQSPGYGYDREERFATPRQRYGMDQDNDFRPELGTNYRGTDYFGSSFGGSAYGRPARELSYRGYGPKGYQRSDERLQEVICERLTEDPFIDPSDITVKVTSGEVTLEGAVQDRRIKYQVEDLIADLGGVKEIRNQLRVRDGSDDGSRSSQDSLISQSSGNGGSGRNTQSASGQSSSESESGSRDKSKKTS